MKTLFLLKMAIFNMTINILNVTMFNRNSTIAQVAIYIEISLLVWGVVYFAIALKQILTNKAIMLLNIKIKNSFVYDQITKQDFATESSNSISKIFNDFKLVETNYFTTFFNYVPRFWSVLCRPFIFCISICPLAFYLFCFP